MSEVSVQPGNRLERSIAAAGDESEDRQRVWHALYDSSILLVIAPEDADEREPRRFPIVHTPNGAVAVGFTSEAVARTVLEPDMLRRKVPVAELQATWPYHVTLLLNGGTNLACEFSGHEVRGLPDGKIQPLEPLDDSLFDDPTAEEIEEFEAALMAAISEAAAPGTASWLIQDRAGLRIPVVILSLPEGDEARQGFLDATAAIAAVDPLIMVAVPAQPCSSPMFRPLNDR